MLQLLELLLVDGVHKELDVSLLCPTSVPVDLLPTLADKDDTVLWQDNVKCMLRGSIFIVVCFILFHCLVNSLNFVYFCFS